MTTKFNIGDWVYAVRFPLLQGTAGDGYSLIYAPIKSMEITELVFNVEHYNAEFTERYRRKTYLTTYIFDLGDNIIKIPEAHFYVEGNEDDRKIVASPYIFLTQEELKKKWDIFKLK